MNITEKLKIEKSDGIGTLTLNQANKRNAISFEMWRDFSKAMAELETDPDVRVIVLTGAGDKAFSAGADISEFGEYRSTPEQRALYSKYEHATTSSLRNSPKFVIARIDGVCVGGGAEIALDCDIQIASDRSRFAITPARIGLGYPVTDVSRLVQNLGPRNAKEILASGRYYTAEEAKAIGWINHVVAANDLNEFVKDYAAGIAQNAPLSVAAAKITVNELIKNPEDRNITACDAAVEACYLSHDYIEGQKAFGEKRPPEFKGQ